MSGERGGRGRKGCFQLNWRRVKSFQSTSSDERTPPSSSGSASVSQSMPSVPTTSQSIPSVPATAQHPTGPAPVRQPAPPAFQEPDESADDTSVPGESADDTTVRDTAPVRQGRKPRKHTGGQLTPQDDVTRRFEITLDGDETFRPVRPVPGRLETHQHIMRELSCIFKRMYSDFWPTWGDVDRTARLGFWDMFSRTFRWDPALNDRVRDAYNRATARRWSQLFHNARKNQTRRPEWIREDLWERLVAHWNDEDYKKKCATASRNRNEGPHLTHGRGTKSASTLAEEHARRNDGVLPDAISLLEMSKSKPPPKGAPAGTRGPVIDEWQQAIDETRGYWEEEFGTDRATWPKQPVAHVWPQPKKGRVILGGRMPQEAFGFDPPKKRPGVYMSQPDPTILRKLEEQEKNMKEQEKKMKEQERLYYEQGKMHEAETQTMLSFLDSQGMFPGLADAMRESRRMAQEQAAAAWAASQSGRPGWQGSTSRANDPTDGQPPPPPQPSQPPQPDDDEDPNQYLNLGGGDEPHL